MPKSKYSELANSIAEGNWQTETTYVNWSDGAGGRTATGEEMERACLIDIMISLRAIRRVLECDNVRRMALATQSIEKMVKQATTKKRKPAARTRK